MEEKQTDIVGWCYYCQQPICHNKRYLSTEVGGIKVYFCDECVRDITLMRGVDSSDEG